MSDQQSAQTETKGQKAYNLKVTPKGSVNTAPTANGKAKMTFRGTFTQNGKTVERTVVAQGAAAELLTGKIVSGEEIGLRCIFSRAPANDDGKPGGEFLTVVALPREQQKAA